MPRAVRASFVLSYFLLSIATAAQAQPSPGTKSTNQASESRYALPDDARRSMLKWGFGAALTGHAMTTAGVVVLARTGEEVSSNLLITVGTTTMTFVTARMMYLMGHQEGGLGSVVPTYAGLAGGLVLGAGLWVGAAALGSLTSNSAIELGVLGGASLLIPAGCVAGSYWGFWRSHKNRVLRRLQYGASMSPISNGFLFSLSASM